MLVDLSEEEIGYILSALDTEYSNDAQLAEWWEGRSREQMYKEHAEKEKAIIDKLDGLVEENREKSERTWTTD